MNMAVMNSFACQDIRTLFVGKPFSHCPWLKTTDLYLDYRDSLQTTDESFDAYHLIGQVGPYIML